MTDCVTNLVPAVLRASADDLEQVGWARGRAVNLSTDIAPVGLVGGPACAALAISLEATRLGGFGDSEKLWTAARAALLRHVHAEDASIVVWNDAPGRTATEVVTALRDAADAVAGGTS